MKIAITGVHSSGKTTLARFCSKKFDLPFVRGDTIHEIIKREFPSKKYDTLNLDECWKLENIGLRNRIAAEQQQSEYVSDGCSLNSIVYARAKLGDPVKEKEEFAEFYEMATENAKNYDFIFYIPPELPLVDDNLRPMDEEFRKLADCELLAILKGFTYFTIVGSVEERANMIQEICGNVGKNTW